VIAYPYIKAEVKTVYNETDYIEVREQRKKIMLLTAGIFLAFLIPAIAFLLRKPQWIGATFLSVGVCLAIFVWGVYGTPIYSYHRFIRDIMEGRTRELKGRVMQVAERPIYKDNRLLYYEIVVMDMEDEVERVVLYDNNKGEPPLEVGRSYTFGIHQNFIVQISK
jgi:hypothetical protein